MAFGDRLAAVRRGNGLTQEQFAEQLQVSRQAVSKWESGRGYPEMEKILYICNRYQVSIADLFAEEAPVPAAAVEARPAPEQEAAGDKQLASAPVQDQRSGGTAQQSAEPQNRSAQQKPQAGPKKQEYASEPTGKTVPFRNTAQAMPEEDIYTVLAAKVQGGMSGSNTLINLETPEKKQTYAYVRGVRPELTPGTQLSHVRLTTRKQDTVVFCVLESYEVYQQGQQAA